MCSLIYLWAYAREAKQSNRFPAKSTLFGAFGSSSISLFALLLATLTPACCSIKLTYASKSRILIGGSVLTAIVRS